MHSANASAPDVPARRYWGFSARELLDIFLIFAVTRAALTGVGWLANRYVPGLYGPAWERLEKPWLDIWYRWDAGYYTAIGTYGYDFAVNRHSAADIAFMPLYPALIHLVNGVIGCVDSVCSSNELLSCRGRECAVVSGVLISNLALLLSSYLFYDLTRRQTNSSVAMTSVWLLLNAPNSIFFSAVYTESLFILFALMTFQALGRENFVLAVVAASLASLTREVGLALFPALVMYAWFRNGSSRWLHLAGSLIPPLVFAAYVVGAGLVAGDWRAYFEVNSRVWGAGLDRNALGSFSPYFPPYQFKEYISLWGAGPSWLNLAAACVYLLLAIPVFRQNQSLGFYSLVAVLIPIAAGTLISMPRFGGVIFPYYTVLAGWADTPVKRVLVTAVFLVGALFFAVRFVTWRWIA